MNELLTPRDLSALIKIPLETLARWRRVDTGPKYLNIGRHVRYDPADIEAWLVTRKS